MESQIIAAMKKGVPVKACPPHPPPNQLLRQASDPFLGRRPHRWICGVPFPGDFPEPPAAGHPTQIALCPDRLESATEQNVGGPSTNCYGY